PRLKSRSNPVDYWCDGVLCLHLCLKQVPTLYCVVFQWRKCCPRRGAFVIALKRYATIPWMDDHIVAGSHLSGKLGGDKIHVSLAAFHRGQLEYKGRSNGYRCQDHRGRSRPTPCCKEYRVEADCRKNHERHVIPRLRRQSRYL